MNSERVGQFLSQLGDDLTAIALGDVALWLVVAVIVFLAVRLARRWIDREIDEVNRRHTLRKAVGYAGFFLVVAVGIALFVGKLGHVATIVGLLGAGLAIALQDVGKSAAGWLYLSSHPGFGPGARVEVGGVVGEVIDVGVLKTTVLEVGNLVYARQSSGRLATIPNSRFLNDIAFINPNYSPYGWQEVSFLFTYESEWRRAVEILEELGEREYEAVAEDTARGFRELEKRYAFKYGTLTPIVYVRAADSGVELTLRYLVHIRQRRGSSDRISRRMLEAVERDPALDFAYPTARVYRRGEERWEPLAPPDGTPPARSEAEPGPAPADPARGPGDPDADVPAEADG